MLRTRRHFRKWYQFYKQPLTKLFGIFKEQTRRNLPIDVDQISFDAFVEFAYGTSSGYIPKVGSPNIYTST